MGWFARNPDHYVTRGGSVVRIPREGWFARVANRAMIKREEKIDAK